MKILNVMYFLSGRNYNEYRELDEIRAKNKIRFIFVA